MIQLPPNNNSPTEEKRLSATTQSGAKKPESSSSKSKTIVITLTLAGVIAVGWYVADKIFGPSEKPFVVMKPWNNKPSSDGRMSAGYEWLHRQCHENLVDLDVDGRIRKRGSADVSRSGARTWSFKLRPDSKWSDDGKPVTVQDYVRGFDLRQGVIMDEAFKRIKQLKSLDVTTISVELDGEENEKLDHDALSSIWLSAVKASTTGKWNYLRELEGPCDGPYVISKISGDEANLKRNKHWYGYDPEMIKTVKILLNDGANTAANFRLPPSELFSKGLISFVEPNMNPDGDTSARASVSGRVFLEPRAHYIVINPKGLLGGDLTAFAHAAISRGELSALVSRPKTLSTMYRILPLSFVAYDDSGQAIYLPPHNLESVAKANSILGISDAQVRTKIPAPFKRKLHIISSTHKELDPVVQRFSDRLGANYNITGEILPMPEAGKLPPTWDVAFVDVDLSRGVPGWANDMIKILNQYAPGRTDLVSKFSSLAKENDQTSISKSVLQASSEIDNLPPKSLVIIPLGQMGGEILLEDGVMDVSWIGDRKRDPDLSRAKRIKKGSKG